MKIYQDPKIVFMGTPEFGAVILERLCQANLKPVLVVTASDKPVGRKQVLTPPPVKVIVQNYNIPVSQPEKIENCKLKIVNYKPELVVVAAYGQILPKEILKIPKFGCINIHPSLLPKYRGSAPVQFAILNGEKETGVTIILMDEQIDHGPILVQKKTVIGSNETAGQLQSRLAVLGAELLIDVIPDWVRGKIRLRRQNAKRATYTKVLQKKDGEINWRKSAQNIERQIRAFYPWPGTYTIYKGKRLKILKAGVFKGRLVIKEVQLEGKKPMAFEEFLRGHPAYALPYRVKKRNKNNS